MFQSKHGNRYSSPPSDVTITTHTAPDGSYAYSTATFTNQPIDS